MEEYVQQFLGYLYEVKGSSKNTVMSYNRDLKRFIAYIEKKNIKDIKLVKEADLAGYIKDMENKNFATSSISRGIAACKSFFHFLFKERKIENDPSEFIKSPKIEKKVPQILSITEVESLINTPNVSTAKGARDKAMFELIYATGMKVSQIVSLNMADINLHLGFILCKDKGKERAIPIGGLCQQALYKYLNGAREYLMGGKETDLLFVNCSGGSLSRQGFWKILKSYADEAGISKDITPHTLRHSFAVHMLQNGADLKTVQDMLGHADASTTEVYLNVGNNKVREVYMKSHPRK